MSTAADIVGTPSAVRSLPTDDYVVDGWLVQPSLNRVAKHTTAIKVRPQLIDVLTCLAARPGAVVSKDELLATVWSDRFVAESGIARCVAELRQLLADNARQPRIIETIPKRGYRLIAEVGPARLPVPGASGHEPAASPPPEVRRGTGAEGPSPSARVMSSARAALLASAVAGLVRRIVG
jgi:DNA-binding winged helix-turn-helix (wHTH) protein